MPDDRPKRVLDVALSASLLVMLSPLILVCALAVWAADGRPVLFRHRRVGRYGRSFEVLKFRTMRREAGPDLTAAADPRVTALGRVLRRHKLDELPQLWNVLIGDMSLVGPRPEAPAYVRRLERPYRQVLQLRPGITDWASLAFRDEEGVLRDHAEQPDFYERTVLPRKLALARLYRRRRSLLVDLRVIAATACVALRLDRLMQAIVGRHLITRARAGIV